MVDTIQTPEPVVAQTVAPVETVPVIETPSQTVTEAPTAVITSEAIPTPEVVQTPLETAPTPPESTSGATEKAPETVLGEALTETPVVEAPKEGEAPAETKNEGGQSDEPAPPPKYDSWTLPEGITLDETKVGDFTSLLAELETSGKADHEAVQAFGQKAVEFHVNEVQNAVKSVTELYEKAWDKQKTDWKESFLKDPEIGGNRFQTTVDSALTFIRTHGGTPEQQTEFRNLMETTGLGNHPSIIRLLANAGRAMSEGRPLAAPKPLQNSKSKTATMYGGK